MNRFVLLCLLLAAFCYLAPASDIHKEAHMQMGKKVRLDLETGGTLDIKGWDKEQVSVDVNMSGRDADRTEVELDESHSGVTLHSYFTSHRMRARTTMKFIVMVPKKADLEIDSKGGAIIIADVEGLMEGTTMGGELDLTRLKGNLDLKTMGGKITLTDSDVDGEVNTMGGEVKILRVNGNVKGHSMGGAVTYQGNTTPTGSRSEEINISSMGGEINLDEAMNGAKVSTMGGEINIGKAAKFVKASTMGGNVKIQSIDGSADASTMGGDVTAHMVGDPSKGDRHVSLSSMGGDITLTVPEGLSMDIDIRLKLTDDADRDYRIISDFPIKQDTSKERHRRHGGDYTEIRGTGSTSGGKHKIKLETFNGNIYLKKAL